jgi:predicted metal-dependent HD superfamily phosphohydrolase
MAEEPATLDPERWLKLWTRLEAAGEGLPVYAQLVRAYAEPTRVYHTAAHIVDCLRQLDYAGGVAERPEEVEAAIWFHDAVYVPAASDNEEQSARLAQTTLSSARVAPETSHRVAAMILATRHQTLPRSPDAQLLCDIDLAILGSDPATFEDYERRIRQEYAWVPEPDYRRARSEILAGFLRRRTVYQTAPFRERYESAARQNLRHSISRLSRASEG